MSARRNSAAVVIFSAVYIITTALLIYFLAGSFHRGKENAGERFQSIIRNTLDVTEQENPLTPSFAEKITKALGNLNDIKKFELSVNEKVIYSYPAGTVSVREKSPLFVHKTTTLFAEESAYCLDAYIYALSPSVIFYWGKYAFLIILINTVCLLLYILFFADRAIARDNLDRLNEQRDEGLSGNPDDVSEAEEEDEYSPEEEEADSDIKFHEEINPENESEDTEIPEFNINSSDESEEEPFVFEDADNLEPPAPEKPASEDSEAEKDVIDKPDEASESAECELSGKETAEDKQPFQEENPSAEEDEPEPSSENNGTDDSIEELSAEEENGEKGLFSEITGFGWESYMLPRLDNELLRSAATEQDVSVFTVRIPGLMWESSAGRRISSKILETAVFKDLVFNYGEDGCTAIIQGLSFDQALKKAETLNKEIEEILKDNSENLKTYIGLSNRSLRLISGSRISNESEQALIHAMEDEESSVVAFKVNPEKYKNYLAGNT